MSPQKKFSVSRAVFAALLLSLFGCTQHINHISGPGGRLGSLKVVNHTGSSIMYVYARIAGTSDWGSDLLGAQPVQAGDSVTFGSLDPGSYDVMVETANHDAYATFSPEVIPAGATCRLTVTSIVNGAAVVFDNATFMSDIDTILLSPTRQNTWGLNRLSGGAYLYSGDTLTIAQVAPDTYDVWVHSSDGSGYSWRKDSVVVSAGQTCTITITDSTINIAGSAVGSLKVVNETSESIYYLYRRPSGSATWGSTDLLGSNSIDGGDSIVLGSLPVGLCDLRADGTSHLRCAVVQGIRIDSLSTVVWRVTALHDSGSTGPALRVVNNSTSYDVDRFYVTPVDSPTWGPNRLSSTMYSGGDSFAVQSLTSGYYNLRVKDDWYNYRAEKRNVYFTGGTTFTWQLADSSFHDWGDLRVLNLSSTDIYAVYRRPNGASAWGSNVLTSDSLGYNWRYTWISIPSGAYDLRVESQDGSYFAESLGVQVSTDTTTVWTVTSATLQTAGKGSLRIVNQVGSTIYNAYPRVHGTTSWGSDLLGSDVIHEGDSLTIDSLDAGVYDIQVLAPDATASYTFSSVTITGRTTTRLPVTTWVNPASITVENLTSYTIDAIWVALSSTTSMGRNRLRSSLLSPGYSYTVDQLAPGTYDVELTTSGSTVYACADWGVVLSANQTYTMTVYDNMLSIASTGSRGTFPHGSTLAKGADGSAVKYEAVGKPK
jgi:hypothetical protein